jgi:hypothetical protein
MEPPSMAIYRLLQNSPMGPEEIRRMTDAYEHALRMLRVTNRSDPITEDIALKIVAITQTGERNSTLIAARAIEQLGLTSHE